MSEQDEFTVGEVAEYLGVSVRTLHHWDHIGLLSPGWRTYGNYRLYTSDDVERGQLVLMYRESGMPLNQIGEALDSGDGMRVHLLRQKHLLSQRLDNVQRMMHAVEVLLELQEETMTSNKIKNILGSDWDPRYQEEANQRWGDTQEWEKSQQAMKSMQEKDWIAAKTENDALAEALVAADADGVKPGSERANELAERHKVSIDRWYATSYSKQVILARMYVDDARFAPTYNHKTEYLRDIVEANAQAHGVDLENVQWEG